MEQIDAQNAFLDCFNRHGKILMVIPAHAKLVLKGGTTNPELTKFTSRELIAELAAKGYRGKLIYV